MIVSHSIAAPGARPAASRAGGMQASVAPHALGLSSIF